MYNGWKNWETWVTVTWLEGVDGMSADEIEQQVREMTEVVSLTGLSEEFLREALNQVDFDEISRAFEDEGGDENIEPYEGGYECDFCGEPASFYNGDQDKLFCEECNE